MGNGVRFQETSKSMAKADKRHLKNKKIKSPTFKHWYSPDRGRTKYGYNTRSELAKLIKKYGDEARA